jgi:septal ring factor EnvC (AmiA/AmiB activator)
MKEFLEMCPMSPPVSTPPPKKKRKTKADIQEELSNALSEITKKERENTSIKEELNKLQEKNKAIEEEKNVIENKLKKFTLPKKKKIKTTQRAKAWDNIIISDKNYNLLQFSFKSKQPMLLRGPSGT